MVQFWWILANLFSRMDMIRGKTLDHVTVVVWLFCGELWRKLKIKCPRLSFPVSIVLRSSANFFTMQFSVFTCISLIRSTCLNSTFLLFNWYCCLFHLLDLFSAILLFCFWSTIFYVVQLKKSKQYCGICKKIWHHSDGGNWVRFFLFWF